MCMTATRFAQNRGSGDVHDYYTLRAESWKWRRARLLHALRGIVFGANVECASVAAQKCFSIGSILGGYEKHIML